MGTTPGRRVPPGGRDAAAIARALMATGQFFDPAIEDDPQASIPFAAVMGALKQVERRWLAGAAVPPQLALTVCRIACRDGDRIDGLRLPAALLLDGCQFFSDPAAPVDVLEIDGLAADALECRGVGFELRADFSRLRLAHDLTLRACIFAQGLRIDDFAADLRIGDADIGGDVTVRAAAATDGDAAENSPATDGRAWQPKFDLSRAQIGGQLCIDAKPFRAVKCVDVQVGGGLRVVTTPSVSLAMDRTNVGGTVLIGSGPVREAKFELCRFDGDFLFDDTGVWGDGGLRIQSGHVGGRLRIERSDPGDSTNVGSVELRSVVIEDVQVGENLELLRCRFVRPNSGEPVAFRARRLKVVGNLRCEVVKVDGRMCFSETRIGGLAFLDDINVEDAAATLDLRGLEVAKQLIVGRDPDVESPSQFPAGINLAGARIGSLMLNRCAIGGPESPGTLDLSDARISSHILLGKGFEVSGCVKLSDATVDGDLVIDDARLSAQKRRSGDHRAPIALDLGNASLGRFEMRAVPKVRQDGRQETQQEMTSPVVGLVNLRGTRARNFVDFQETWPGTDSTNCDRLLLDGFTYERLEHPDGAPRADVHETLDQARIGWLDGAASDAALLGTATPPGPPPAFQPQPWAQLARVLDRQGHHEAAIEILIKKRERERTGKCAGLWFADWLLFVLARYGYNPWRTVGWSIVTVAAFFFAWCGIVAVWCQDSSCRQQPAVMRVLRPADGALPQRASTAAAPDFSPAKHAIETFFPLFDLRMKTHWQPDTDYWCASGHGCRTFGAGANASGAWLHVEPASPVWGLVDAPTGTMGAPERRPFWWPVGWLVFALVVFEMIVGIAMTALMIAGFTGLLREGNRMRGG